MDALQSRATGPRRGMRVEAQKQGLRNYREAVAVGDFSRAVGVIRKLLQHSSRHSALRQGGLLKKLRKAKASQMLQKS